MIQGQLGLSFREPENPKPALVEKLTPKHIQKWLETLPVANVSDSSKRLYQILLDCNKSQLSDDDRFKILMKIHSPIQIVLKSLSRHFTGHTLNLSEKQKKIAALVQAIHTEMAIGFKTIIEHQIESPSLLKRGMLHASMFMALEYLSLTVVRCYQVYTDIPARLWKEINLIYRSSLEQKIQDKECEYEGFQHEHSIRDIFVKICLLSMANPYQLRQQEIETVFNGLQKYVEHCKVENASRFENRYVVDLNQARPPIHQALIKMRPNKDTIAFNLDDVVAELQEHLQKSSSEKVSAKGLSLRLTRHLLKNWAHLSSRNFARTACDGHIRVSIGLSATFQILKGTDTESDEPTTLEEFEGSLHNVTLVDDHETVNMLDHFGNENYQRKSPDEDIWAKMYRPKEAAPDSKEVDYAKAFGSDKLKSHAHYDLLEADIVNISPGGYCIVMSENTPNNTQTGEVIGLVETEADGHETWHIGVIRWIKRVKGTSGVQLGIQLIAPGAKPILSQLKNGKTRGQSFQNALMLPALKGIDQPATLLTNPILFTTEQKVTIVDGTEKYDVRLTKLVSSSQGYRQFYFEPIKSSQSTGSSLDISRTDEGFDDVWDLI
ncbi:hypothetical protein [Pleionea sediminis]|uniref:hypothetical protein n=1 Tax=Pleionea sediminis TaxID=2569479 RepID=UPI00118674E1|nr:hypothetical protein [Pleionea sediminis]